MDYSTWNNLIGGFFFRPDRAGERIFLTVDPDTLLQIAAPRQTFVSPESAVTDFSQAVRKELDWRPHWGLPEHRPPLVSTGQYPGVLGFAAIQVLAVHRMEEHEDYTDQAYWPCLRALLTNPDEPNGHNYVPLGNRFYNNHQTIWHKHIELWANSRQYNDGALGRIVLPDTERQAGRRHMALPLSQALLRLADLAEVTGVLLTLGSTQGDDELDAASVDGQLESYLRSRASMANLPDFLRQQNRTFEPGERLRTLCGCLLEHGGPQPFSRHALRPLSDERCVAVCEQLADHLYRGGAATAPLGSRGVAKPTAVPTSVRIWLHWETRTRSLKGGLLWRRGKGEWQRANITLDAVLKGGLQKVFNHGNLPEAYRPPSSGFVFAVRGPEYVMERRFAAPGDRVWLLGPVKKLQPLMAGCERLAKEGKIERHEGGVGNVPADWLLLGLQLCENIDESSLPDMWRNLIRIRPQVRIIGGLGLSRGIWMAGAAPNLRVVGRRAEGTRVLIDALPYEIDLDGWVQNSQDTINKPGEHLIWLEGHSRLALRLLIHKASLGEPDVPHLANWARPPHGWPLETATPDTTEVVRGPVVQGDWLPARSAVARSSVPEPRLALEYLLRQRGYWRLLATPADMAGDNPLIRLLAGAAKRREELRER